MFFTVKFGRIGETLSGSWRQVVFCRLISLQIVYALVYILSLVIWRHRAFVLVFIDTHLDVAAVTIGYAVLLWQTGWVQRIALWSSCTVMSILPILILIPHQSLLQVLDFLVVHVEIASGDDDWVLIENAALERIVNTVVDLAAISFIVLVVSILLRILSIMVAADLVLLRVSSVGIASRRFRWRLLSLFLHEVLLILLVLLNQNIVIAQLLFSPLRRIITSIFRQWTFVFVGVDLIFLGAMALQQQP